MKLSNVLLLSLCVGTLLVQIFLNLGYQKPYEAHLAFVKNQSFKVNSFPSENIKVVLARGVRFTVHSTQKQQGFIQDVRPFGITFAMKGDTLLINAKNDGNKNDYFEVYFKQIPTLILQDANVNVVAKTQEYWQVFVEKRGSLLIEQSNFQNVSAVVSDSSLLTLRANVKINALQMTLRNKAILTDEGANLKMLQRLYVSDSARVNLSGRNLRIFRQ